MSSANHQYLLRPLSSSSMTPSNKKSRKTRSDSTTDLDGISDLPENVLDQILSNLPIKDAVKTSMLSTKWRYKYETMSSLVFDDRSMYIPSMSLYERPAEIKKLASFIDRVIFFHSGPIHRFEMAISIDLPVEEIEKWIKFVSRRNLKVFAFQKNYVQTRFHVPSSMFSCQTLTDLELNDCFLQPPKTFKGFQNLKSLKLGSVDLCVNVLESLISNSPVLEKLHLEYCDFFDHDLRISAPNLKQLIIIGDLIHLRLENTPSLIELSINMDECYDRENALCIEMLLASLPQIQCLDIGYSYCKILGEVHKDNPASLVKLSYLSVNVNFMEIKEYLYLFSFLKCAPNLQELQIKSEHYDEDWSSDSGEPGKMSGSFTNLRCLKLTYMSDSKAEMDFISFMLSSSPALETVTIDYSYGYEKNMMKQLLSFARASPKAKIIIL